jgi:KDO2-lipid IV(A) lauroyltransferase
MPEAELTDLVRAGLRSYARYWQEAFRLPSMDKNAVVARFDLDGVDVMDKSIAAGHGVVLVLPHMGNWDNRRSVVDRARRPVPPPLWSG